MHISDIDAHTLILNYKIDLEHSISSFRARYSFPMCHCFALAFAWEKYNNNLQSTLQPNNCFANFLICCHSVIRFETMMNSLFCFRMISVPFFVVQLAIGFGISSVCRACLYLTVAVDIS